MSLHLSSIQSKLKKYLRVNSTLRQGIQYGQEVLALPCFVGYP